MDLGIKGKHAIVCASSKGLGFGCAKALAEAGVNLTMCARNEENLLKSKNELLEFGIEIKTATVDITTENGQQEVLKLCPNPDILINNAGGPPPGLWSDWDRSDFIKALDANMLTPIALTKAVLPKMIKNKWGRVINITSKSVKAPIPALGLSNASRTGLTGYVAGTSRQVASDNVTINNLLPGSHYTDRIKMLEKNAASKSNISIEKVRENNHKKIPCGRYGTIEEFGATCAFICSIHAGFIVGQNILIDGGEVFSTL